MSTIQTSTTRSGLIALPSPVPVLLDVDFEEGEVDFIRDIAQQSGQSLQEFMAQAVREGIARRKAAKGIALTLPPPMAN